MPTTRRPSKHLRPPRPLSTSHAHVDVKGDGQWIIRDMAAAAALKMYTCGGCSTQIQPGTAHLVVWPREPKLGSESGVEDRRHWHTFCWKRRP